MNNDDIFQKIKTFGENDLIKYISNNPDIDFNIKDANGVYLIYHALSRNDINILDILLKHNTRIDVYDLDGKSILHNPIKYGYNDIVRLLLKYNETTIGIPIQSITDDSGNTALHYSIMYKNFECFELLLPLSNIQIVNKQGDNILLTSAKYRLLDFVRKILITGENINIQNNVGESVLHIACRNSHVELVKYLLSEKINTDIQEYEMQSTALHYACSLGNDKIVSMLLNAGADTNIQDYDGNTPLHYAILYDKVNVTNVLLTHKKTVQKINVNLFNINLLLPLHIALNENTTNLHTYITLLLRKTNINFQNKNGNTCLHELCSKNLWKKYSNILEYKKNDILIENYSKKRPIDLIDKNDTDIFILTISKSYMNELLSKKEHWSDQWKKDCPENLNICLQKTHEKIKSLIDQKYKCDDRTYPSSDFSKKCIELITNKRVAFNTLVGSDLDIWCGYLYAMKKHKNVIAILNQINTNDKSKINFHIKYGIPGSTTHELLFENTFITWFKQILDISENTKKLFMNIIDNVKKSNEKQIIIIMYVAIIESNGSRHANALIYDCDSNELERFDPFGSGTYENLDDKLNKYFSALISNVKYISPKDYMTPIGLQKIDVSETQNEYVGDPNGYCVAWSNWYIDMRASYPELNRIKLIKYIIQQITFKQLKFRSIIRDYSKNITSLRDNILNKVNIDINQFTNNEINEDTFNSLVTEFNKHLSKLYKEKGLEF